MIGPKSLIEKLELQPHPEGGWYRETWRGENGPDGRASETAIHFLLEQGQASHWHRVDATEIWCWHAGSALSLSAAPGDDGPVTSVSLGPDVMAGELPHHVIAPGAWQTARADRDWALVSCIVSPGFEFSGFTLAPPGWAPGQPS
ncbi:MAG: cupin domain-containing protein [Blastomonas sp.]